MASYQSFGDRKGASNSSEKLQQIGLPNRLSGKSVLDIGCNEGFFCFEAKSRGATRVVGLDKSPQFIELAQQRAKTAGADIEFVCSNANDRLPSGSFSIILFLSALHYFDDPHRILSLIHEALEPNGLLILECGVADGAGTTVQRALRSIDDRMFPTMPLLREVWLRDFAVREIAASVPQAGDPVPRKVLHCHKSVQTVMLIVGDGGSGKTNLAWELQDCVVISTDILMSPVRNWERYHKPNEQMVYEAARAEAQGSIRRGWNTIKHQDEILQYAAVQVAKAIRMCRGSKPICVEGYILGDIADRVQSLLGADFRTWIMHRNSIAEGDQISSDAPNSGWRKLKSLVR